MMYSGLFKHFSFHHCFLTSRLLVLLYIRAKLQDLPTLGTSALYCFKNYNGDSLKSK